MHKIEIAENVLKRVMTRRGHVHMFEQIQPAQTAHVVVDLQNGFMAPGQPTEIPAAREIVPNVNRLSTALRTSGGTNIFIQHTMGAQARTAWSNRYRYYMAPEWGDRLDKVFEPGSEGHALWPGLDVQPQDLKVRKFRFGAFVPGSSDLHAILQERRIDTLIVTGTATNVCCESTARDAMMMNYKVIFVSDGTATHSDAEHNAALANMVTNFADVMTADEVLACIAGSAATGKGR
ncbi:MAG: cysteine hydrolase [Betaproteobacteria bacterium]|nr:cysteine hydrolase [Betaproteobacteria bacterium]